MVKTKKGGAIEGTIDVAPGYKPTSVAVAISEAVNELASATVAHGPMISDHDGYAVILEELDELWEEVRKKPSKRSRKNMRKEATQIAAMALRFMVDRT